MAIRPIDGDELLGITRLLDTDVVRQSKTASWLLDQVLHDIQAMPTITQPNEWVSVEERLPEYNPGAGAKSYWVVKKDNAGNWQMKIAQYCDYGYAMTVDAETEITWRDWDFTKIVNVTHWMPLPAPPDRRPPEGEGGHLMDIEKLIERLYEHDKDYGEGRTQDFFRVCLDCKDAATALSTLQAENEKLRNEVERQRRSADDRKHLYENAERAYMKVMAELEQVKREKDAAVSWAQKYTESIDMPCVACKHNTGDYVCTAICGNCGPMGAESCKWEFDFSGELKED